jgi:hypothetical protein
MYIHSEFTVSNPAGGYTAIGTLIFIMIGFFLAKKENTVVPNAVETSRTGAFWSQDQMLSFFSG